MNILELDPLVEVTHLRHLLDTQPSCLMRLGADGTVLAASDAALKLIGATAPAQALGRDFSAWVPLDQRDRWTAFTTGVVRGCPASVECDIEAPSGDRLPTLFHGMPLTDHPDGLASMAVADVQQLELALDAFAARQKPETAHASLAAAHALLTEEHARLVRSLHQMVVQMEALASGFPVAAAATVEHGAPGGVGTGGEEGVA